MAEENKIKVPNNEDGNMVNDVLQKFTTSRNISARTYPQFDNRNLFDVIDDWSMRWNGYTSLMSSWDDELGLNPVFLNFTRNATISYLSKAAMTRPETKFVAVNKKTGLPDKKFAQFLNDLNKYSLIEENGDARYLEAELERVVKGTCIIYEGYAKHTQKTEVATKFDSQTGKLKTEKENRVTFDNCFQKIVPLEDFYIANPYQPDVQKQPYIIWRELTTFTEAKMDFGHYPKWDEVKAGSYVLAGDTTTFYRNQVISDLQPEQVEILRYYNRAENKHCVLVNGVVLYDGPFPFRDGLYPFAKGINEPYDNFFFWGMGFPNKIQGEQDLMNESWSTMSEKNRGSLRPYGLSSDLDDIIEDDVIRVNKIRKVSDISKWKFDTLPAVNAAEIQMLQQTVNFAREFSGDMSGGADAMTSKGGKVTARQALLQQKESQQRLSYSMNFSEDMERDRTILRTNHLLQFTSIPKLEKISGLDGQTIQQLVYRDIKLSNVELSDGQVGNKVIKLVDNSSITNEDSLTTLKNDLSVTEEMGEEMGVPTEALAISVDTYYDYNFSVQVVKNSSYQRNQILDQASRQEYANWRISMAQLGVPTDIPEIIKWVDESYDIDTDRFTPEQQMGPPGMPGQPPQPGMQPAQQMAPSSMLPKQLTEMML